MLYVVRELVPDQQYVHGTINKLPDEVLGALVVVETGEKTSTGVDHQKHRHGLSRRSGRSEEEQIRAYKKDRRYSRSFLFASR